MPGSPLRLNLLGSPTLWSGERPVALSPSATLLCAYLALAPSAGRPRALAAAELFADCEEAAARRRLNTTLWRLRTEVKAHVGLDIVSHADARLLALDEAAGLVTDAVLLEELVASVVRGRPEEVTEADAARLAAAVDLHRGTLVEACHDEWVLAERYRIENLYLTALDYLVQHHGRRRDVAAVTHYGELALEVEPLREDVHRHLINAYGSAGRDDLVERQFERCRLLLLDHLGADPMPETVVAYARFRRSADASAGPVAADVDALLSELERARREVERLASSVDRALAHLRELGSVTPGRR